MICSTTIHWGIYIGQEVEPGRYMVMLSNEAILMAERDPVNGWVDDAGKSLSTQNTENFVVAFAGPGNIQHNAEPAQLADPKDVEAMDAIVQIVSEVSTSPYTMMFCAAWPRIRAMVTPAPAHGGSNG